MKRNLVARDVQCWMMVQCALLAESGHRPPGWGGMLLTSTNDSTEFGLVALTTSTTALGIEDADPHQ